MGMTRMHIAYGVMQMRDTYYDIDKMITNNIRILKIRKRELYSMETYIKSDKDFDRNGKRQSSDKKKHFYSYRSLKFH